VVSSELADRLDAALDAAAEVSWSVCIAGHDGDVLYSHGADRALSTASVGKVLLLIAVARRIELGLLDPNERLTRTPELSVADSGLWQHLCTDSLPVTDLAVLVAAVSDNFATNVLLARVGLDVVRRLAFSLGLRQTGLLDRVRDVRTPDHPPALSVGSARELSELFGRIGRRELLSPNVSDQLDRWLATGVDLSMVAGAFNFDPLAHREPDRTVVLRNKTGTDASIRADVGCVAGPANRLSYAVLANWDLASGDRRDTVMAAMKLIGAELRRLIA